MVLFTFTTIINSSLEYVIWYRKMYTTYFVVLWIFFFFFLRIMMLSVPFKLRTCNKQKTKNVYIHETTTKKHIRTFFKITIHHCISCTRTSVLYLLCVLLAVHVIIFISLHRWYVHGSTEPLSIITKWIGPSAKSTRRKMVLIVI